MPDTLADFERDVARAIKESHDAFVGIYRDEINDLAGLSKAEIDEIVPGTADLEAYDTLMAVVKAASRRNVATAELKGHIESLGEVAVTIARKVPRLARLFL
jgi:hypothetical protein